MLLSEFSQHLDGLSSFDLLTPDGTPVPAHFHITEAGLTTKTFVDCGGKLREEKTINLQVWVGNDTEHRITPEKVNRILNIAKEHFGTADLPVEIEYQNQTLGRYGVAFYQGTFQLTPKFTDCLAKEHCGVAETSTPPAISSCCAPGSGCC